MLACGASEPLPICMRGGFFRPFCYSIVRSLLLFTRRPLFTITAVFATIVYNSLLVPQGDAMEAIETVTIQQLERVRRLSVLARLLYACGGVLLVLIVLLIMRNGITSTTALLLSELAGLLVAVLVAWVLARAGHLEAATHVFCVGLVVATLVTALPSGVQSSAFYALFIPIVAATLLLRPFWSFVYAGLALAVYVYLYITGPTPDVKTVMGGVFNTVLFGAYFGIIALLAYLASHGYNRLLDATLERAAQLERARAELEDRVIERTRSMQQALDDLQRTNEIVHQMSVPVIPVADGVLALPLVGAIDSQRAALISERLLQAIHAE